LIVGGVKIETSREIENNRIEIQEKLKSLTNN
jgi:hypothetical protein